jgi:hypothetical protein
VSVLSTTLSHSAGPDLPFEHIAMDIWGNRPPVVASTFPSQALWQSLATFLVICLSRASSLYCGLPHPACQCASRDPP